MIIICPFGIEVEHLVPHAQAQNGLAKEFDRKDFGYAHQVSCFCMELRNFA